MMSDKTRELQELLRSLSPEELEAIPRLSEEEIRQALLRGQAEKKIADSAVRPVSSYPNIRFRS